MSFMAREVTPPNTFGCQYGVAYDTPMTSQVTSPFALT
jgi:hypothetical protein